MKKSISVLGLLLLLFSLASCDDSNQNKNRAKTKKSTYEPKFSKDADGFLVNALGDTLHIMDVEYAKTSEQIQYGMMYRKSMTKKMGMLFFLPRLEMQSFWMRNTYVSLDIVYLDEDKKVVSIQKNAQPLSDKSLPSEGPAKFVYEIKGGLSDEIGLIKGDQLIIKE